METNRDKNEQNEVTFKKIPLEPFIQALADLYDKGADYIDISGVPDKEQDMLSIIVRVEYIDPENNKFKSEDEDTIIIAPDDSDEEIEIDPMDLI